MKKGSIILLQGLMVCQMNHWILYLIPLTLAGLCGFEKPVFIGWLLMSLIPMLYCVIRRFSNGFWLFLLSHLAGTVSVYFLPSGNWVEKVMQILIAVVYLIYSFYLRLKTEDRLEHSIHPCMAVVISGGGLLFQKFEGTQAWDEQYVLALIFFLGLYMVHIYLEQYVYFLRVNDINKGRIPEKAMFQSGFRLILVFVGMIVGLLFLTSGVGWVGQITKMLKNILFWILHLLFKKQEQLTEEPVIGQNEPMVNNNAEFMPMEPAETFWLWIVLEKIYTAAVFIAAAFVLIKLLQALYRFLYNKFHESVELWNQAPEEGIIDIREKCEVERVKRKVLPSLSGFLSVKERIRRIYKKEVWSSRLILAESGDARLLERMTARECAEKLDKKRLAEVYEKARYSSETCSSEDIKIAKMK